MPHPLFERHKPLLDRALQAISERGYWSPFPESPKAYDEHLPAYGKAAFEALLNKPFPLTLPGMVGKAGAETSPYGLAPGAFGLGNRSEQLLERDLGIGDAQRQAVGRSLGAHLSHRTGERQRKRLVE